MLLVQSQLPSMLVVVLVLDARVLLSFGPLLVPFQRAKVSNCLLKDEAVQRYCCRHEVNGCAAPVGGFGDCPSARRTVHCIQLHHTATLTCIAQLQCRAKAVNPSNASKKHMSCGVRHCQLFFCACLPYAYLPAVMFYATQCILSLLVRLA